MSHATPGARNSGPDNSRTYPITAFLTTLFSPLRGLDAGDLVIIGTRGDAPRRREFVPVDDPERAARVALEYESEGRKVYSKVCTHDEARAREGSTSSAYEGNAASARYATCFWADVDFAEGNHASDRLPPRELALDVLGTMAVPPTLTVLSGGGCYPYWVLDEPVDLDASGAREAFKDRIKRFQGYLQERFLERGYEMDGTADLARQLKLTGVVAPGYHAPDGSPFVVHTIEEGRLAFAPGRFHSMGDLVANRGRYNGKEVRRSRTASPRRVTTDSDSGGIIPNGKRNATLTSIAGSMRRSGMSAAEMFPSLMAVNKARCEEPLSEEEVWRIVRSVANYEPGAPVTAWVDRLERDVRGGSSGQRGEALFLFGCRMKAQGLGEDAVLAALLERNEAEGDGEPLEAAEVERIAAGAARYEPGCDTYPLTDLGNAERFAKEHGDALRYHTERGVWLHYAGGVWSEDSAEAVQERQKRTVRRIQIDAEFASAEQKKSILAHAKRSESRAALANMLTLAQGETGMGVGSGDLDVDPLLLNVTNGTVDLRTGVLHEHRAEDLLSKQTNFAYDERALCPLWEAFVLQVMGGDEGMVAFLQRALGYSITGLTDEQVLFFLYGDGANGKSVFVEVVMEVFGPYGQKAPTEMLVERRFSAIPNDIARLAGARLAVAAEASEGVALDEARVKDLTGGDKLVARFMRQDLFQFDPTHTLWAYGNHIPLIRGTDDGIWRRLQIVPFDVSIPEERRDPMLKQKLLSEGAGILRWIVEGSLGWQRVGLQTPEKVKRLSRAHRVEMDQTRRFLDEACEIGDDLEEESGAVYDAYVRWCHECGEEPVTKAMLGRKLNELGYRDRRTNSARYRVGLQVSSRLSGIKGPLIL